MRKLSRGQLAARVGVDESQVAKWEMGQRLITTTFLSRLAAALFVTLRDLTPPLALWIADEGML